MKPVFQIIFCFFLIAAANAQHPHYYSVNEEQGLPTNEIYDLLQDEKGFIWAGTSAGLFRYDGIRFQKFSNKAQNSVGISHLIIDNNQKLWCQNFTGQIFFVQNDSLHLALDRSNAQANFPVFAIDHNGLLYLSSDTGIHVFENHAQKTFYRLNEREEKEIRCIFTHLLKSANKLFYAERSGIGYFENDTHFSIKKTNRPERYADVLRQSSLFEINQKILLLAQGEKKYSLWQIKNDSIVWLRDLPESLGSVYSLHNDKQGKIWVGSSKGTMCLDENLKELFNGKIFFSDKSISKVLLDKENNYWFATLQEGIFIVPSLDVWVYREDNSMLADTRIRKLETDLSGNLFIGYQNGALSKMNVAAQTITTVSFPDSPKEIQALKFDAHKQQLLVGQNNSWLVNAVSMKAQPVLNDINLKTITPTNEDTFLLGSVHQAYLAKLNGQFTRIKTLRNKRVRSSHYESEAKRLWIGYTDGLFIYENDEERELLFNNEKIYAIAIVATNDKMVWAATVNNGVLGFLNGKQTIQLKETISITDGFVRALTANGNYLWIASEKNLIRYDFMQKTHAVFNIFDGLPNMEIADMKVLGDKIFLATPKGLVLFPVALNPNNTVAPKIFITGFSITERDTLLLPQYILPYSENNIKIDFIGTGFRSRGNLTYQYRMSGLDTAWISTFSNINFVRYQSLPAGKYLFEVKALNEDGVESEKPATIEIEILKPYWQQWWFYLLIMLSFGGFISLLYSLRIRYLNKRNELEKRMANSQLAALKAQMNPHFMFNALSSIQDLILQQKTHSAQYYLGKFSELTRIVLEASGQEFITLEKEINILALYLELESLRFEGELKYTLRADDSIDSEFIKIPSMVVQPFVENALKHGLLHKEGEKQLHVIFSSKENYIQCVVEDNGIGRNASEKIKERRKHHQSFATKATDERLTLLREYYKLKMELEVVDLNENNFSTGTRVILKIFNQEN